MSKSINLKLAFVALALSFGAMVNSLVEPHTNHKKIPSITVLELAEQIRSYQELMLVDLRSPDDFDLFHIPTAKNLTLNELLTTASENSLKTILYSSDRRSSLEAAFIMKKKGVNNLYILEGGAHDWYHYILYPEIPLEIDPEYKGLADSVKELSAYYGGQPKFVEDKRVLDYYRNPKKAPIQTIDTELVRMGC